MESSNQSSFSEEAIVNRETNLTSVLSPELDTNLNYSDDEEEMTERENGESWHSPVWGRNVEEDLLRSNPGNIINDCSSQSSIGESFN